MAKSVSLLVTIAFLALTACSTAPATHEARSDLRGDSANAVAKATQNNPAINRFFLDAAGYAVFPSVGKGAVGVGGAYGKGDLYQDGAVVGYCDLSQVSIGGQKFSYRAL